MDKQKQQTNGCDESARIPAQSTNHAQATKSDRQAMKSASDGRASSRHHHPMQLQTARPRRHSPATVPPSSPTTSTTATLLASTGSDRRITRHSPPSSVAPGTERSVAAKPKGLSASGISGAPVSKRSNVSGANAASMATAVAHSLPAHGRIPTVPALAIAKRSQPTSASIAASLAEITPLSNAKSSSGSGRHHFHSSSHHHHGHRDHHSSHHHTSSSNQLTAQLYPTTNSAGAQLPIGITITNSSALTSNKRKRLRPRPELSPSSSSSAAEDLVRASKRVRLQHQPFQSPSPASIIPAILRHTPVKSLDEKILVFQRGDFLAVRNENGGFFVCRTAQNVYKSSKRFKIQWMNNDRKPELYTPDFYDHTDFECILTNLRMRRVDKNKFLLPKDEQQRTENILQRALNVENGMDVPDPLAVTKDGVDVSIVGKEEEEEVVKHQSPKKSSPKVVKMTRSMETRGRGRPKKAETPSKDRKGSKKKVVKTAVMKVRARARATARAKMRATVVKGSNLTLRGRVTPGTSSSSSNSSRRGRPIKTTPSPGSASSTVKSKKKEKREIETLQPNPKVIVFEKDPTYETNLPIPFISTAAHSRLLIRSVLLSDPTLLQALLADTKNVCSLTVTKSLHIDRDAFTYAVMREDHQLIRSLLKAQKRNYAKPPDVLMNEDFAGKPNSAMFGHHLRAVNISRGGREGNNALLKDQFHYNLSYPSFDYNVVKQAMKSGVSMDTLNLLCEGDKIGHTRNDLYGVILEAIRHGHHKLAGQLVKEAAIKGGFGFNKLHQDVLLFENEPLPKFKPVSVVKKSTDNGRITPLHCAAINPNPSYLSALLASTMQHSIVDKNGWQPIHYAAVCLGPGPLKLLLSRGVSLSDIDSEGNTPLHLACRAGRIHNVDIILKHLLSSSHKLEEDERTRFREHPNKNTYTPLHLAANQGHTDIVRLLLSYKADPEKTLGAAQDKMTALMLAAQQGHFQVVKTLVEHCAKVEAKDKKHRTALTHAIMDGHAHVASYLLRLGADPNSADSSGNSLVHYAAAYGWYFCLKLLAEAGAALHVQNEWKLTPLSIAFIKGHVGLVDFLLGQPGADIDVCLDNQDGLTLLMQTVRAQPNSSMLERVRLLVDKFQCDCSKVDAKGNNALHHLVQAEVHHRENLWTDESSEFDEKLGVAGEDSSSVLQEEEIQFQTENRNEHDSIVEKIAELLLTQNKSGAQVKNSEAETPFTLAVKQGSLVLVKEFMKMGCVLYPEQIESADETILHSLVKQAAKKDIMPLYQAILKSPDETCPKSVLVLMAHSYNQEGYTPLLLALKLIPDCKRVESHVCLIQLVESLLVDLDSDITKVVKNPTGFQSTALHLASCCPEKTAMEFLLSRKPESLDLLDAQGRTPLLIAINKGNGSVAEALILAGANVNIRSPADGNLPSFLLAATNPKLMGVVNLLAQSKTTRNLSEIDPKTGNNALHFVVAHQVTEVLITVRSLVESGGLDVNTINHNRMTPLHLAVNANPGNSDAFFGVEEYLLAKGSKMEAVDYRGRIPLHYAFLNFEIPDDTSHHDPIELVTLLVSHCNNASQVIEMVDHFGQTSLHCAANRGAAISCLHLCQQMKNYDPRDIHGNTPLGLAVLNGHEGCSLMLLQRGANCMADVVPPPKGTPNMWQWHYLQAQKAPVRPHSILKEAIRHDWQGILFLMLDQLEVMGKGLSLAVEAALQCQKYQLALKLISRVKHGWTLYSEKQSMLHTLALEARPGNNEQLQLKVAQALLDKGVPPMARDEHGCSVLTYAAMNWNHVLCHFFTDLIGMTAVVKADPDKSFRTPFSALFWNLKQEDFPKAVKAWCLSLLEAGATPDVLTAYPIRESPYPGVSCLLTHNTHEEPGSGYRVARLSPLVRAIYAGNLDVARFLLNNRAHVDFCDDLQRTPLMHAARINNLKMVKLLLNPKYNPEEESRAFSNVNLRKTSDTDLTRQDIQGWTVLHHAVAPLPTYSYVSTSSLLQLLGRLGAPLDTPDTTGLTARTLAAGRGCQHLVDCLEKLLQTKEEDKAKVTVEAFPEAFDGIVVPPTATEGTAVKVWDYKKDSSEALNQIKKQEETPQKFTPHSQSGFANVGEVAIDSTQNVPYDVLLTIVDINYGTLGLYNYYRMQVIRHPVRDLVLLFTNWGRVGDQGQHQKTPFATLEEAIKEFCKIFKSKTGNAWESIKSFEPQPKKYRLVSLDKRINLPKSDIKISLSRKVASKLPKPLESLMWELMNFKTIRKSLRNHSIPDDALQVLNHENLLKGEALLKEITQVINQQQTVSASDPRFNQLTNKLLEMSEEFYQLVPVEGYQYDKLLPLVTLRDVNEKQTLVHSLLHLETGGQMIIGANSKSSEISPADYVYSCLHCRLEYLKPESCEAQLLLQYLRNTASEHNKPQVEAIFRISRESERIEDSKLNNHALLWHGTPTANLLGILSSGLRISPLDTRVTSGDSFGRGIYFADMFEKSQPYTFDHQHNSETKFMLVCEVALGRNKEVTLDTPLLAEDCDSFKALGRREPDPTCSVTWRGATVPLGPGVEMSENAQQLPGETMPMFRFLSTNEYVVQKEDQVALRYVVQFKQ